MDDSVRKRVKCHHVRQIPPERLRQTRLHFSCCLSIEGQQQKLAWRHTAMPLHDNGSSDQGPCLPTSCPRHNQDVAPRIGDCCRLLGVEWMRKRPRRPILYEACFQCHVLGIVEQFAVRVRFENPIRLKELCFEGMLQATEQSPKSW